jgi:hypothetical protein
MPILLQLAQSYSNPDSVTYKLAYLREQVEQQLLSLGDLAYADQVQLAMLGETIMVGGYLKTELIDAKALHIGDAESNVFVSKDGIIVQNGTITIKDANNRAVITSDGLRIMYMITSSGELNGWQKCGIWDEWDSVYKRACTLNIYLPSDLLIESGTLYARSMPSYRTGWAGIPDGFYHPRNLRLYKGNTAEDGFLDFPAGSEYGVIFGQSGRTDITSAIWGSAWTPSGQGIKEKSGDITSQLTAGQAHTFIVETSDSVTYENSRYMGAMQLEIVVEGFLRG